MVNGRYGEVWRLSACVVVLVAACGGKSVSRGEDPGNDAGDGGTSSGRTGASKGGGSTNPPQSASGGVSQGPTLEPPVSAGTANGGASSDPPQSATGGAPSASGGTPSASGGASPGSGAPGSSGGLAGNAGGPSLAMLDDLCENICTRGANARCDGIELADCRSSCYSFAALVENTAQCATAAYRYLACVNALPNICELNDETVCSSTEVVQCALAYCQQHPGTVECTSTSAPQG